MLIELYRSDTLSDLRRLVEQLLNLPRELQPLISLPPQIPIVIDANQALADIVAKARARAKNYRTDLEELVDSSAIVLHAPDQLVQEVEGAPKRGG